MEQLQLAATLLGLVPAVGVGVVGAVRAVVAAAAVAAASVHLLHRTHFAHGRARGLCLFAEGRLGLFAEGRQWQQQSRSQSQTHSQTPHHDHNHRHGSLAAVPLGQNGRSCLQSASTLLNCCGQPVGGALPLTPLDLQQIRTKSL